MRGRIGPLLVLSVCACQPAAVELSEAEKTAIANRVTAAVETYWDTWSQLDVDRALSNFHDTPETSFAWEGGAVQGLETMRGEWERAFAVRGKQGHDPLEQLRVGHLVAQGVPKCCRVAA